MNKRTLFIFYNYRIVFIFICLSRSLLFQEIFSQQNAVGGFKVYFGHLHNHSNFSDGIGSPMQAFKYARDSAGLDFLGLADHRTMLTQTEWEELLLIADSISSSAFVAFCGFEWTSQYYGHVTVVAGDSTPILLENDTSFTAFLDRIAYENVVAFFNHPGREDYFNTEFLHFSSPPSKKIVGIELWNRNYNFQTFFFNDGYYSGDGNLSFMDEANTRGWKLGSSGSEDNHYGNWGNYVESKMAVLSDSLSNNNLFEAFQARRFYSTLDRNIFLSFKMNGNEMGSEIGAGNTNIEVNAFDGDSEKFVQAVIYKSGIPFKTYYADTNHLSIIDTLMAMNGEYFYILLSQSDGDMCISSPIFVRDTVTQTEKVYPEKTFFLFPNPCSDKINIIHTEEKSFQYKIYSPEGKMLINGYSSSKEFTIDISILKSGIYFICLGNNEMYKFIKFLF